MGALLDAGCDKDTKDKVRGFMVQGESGAVRCGSYLFVCVVSSELSLQGVFCMTQCCFYNLKLATIVPSLGSLVHHV